MQTLNPKSKPEEAAETTDSNDSLQAAVEGGVVGWMGW